MEVMKIVGYLDTLKVELEGSADKSDLECERGVSDFKEFGLNN